MSGSETLRILVLREGDMLVAQCLEHDICTQAKDMDQLRFRMDGLLALERAETRELTGQDFGGIPPAPEFFHKMWEDAEPLPSDDAPYQMKRAA